MAALPLTKWHTSLFDCFDDMNACCYGFWCCPCFACTTTGKFGESSCLPLLDICSPAITSACAIPLCVPPAGLSLRVAMRHKYGIKGTLCEDIMTSCFCTWCSWCQMAREIKKRQKGHAVINVQSQPPPVNMQPVSVGQPQMASAPGYGPQVLAPATDYGYPPPVNPAMMGSPPGYGPPPPNLAYQSAGGMPVKY